MAKERNQRLIRASATFAAWRRSAWPGPRPISISRDHPVPKNKSRGVKELAEICFLKKKLAPSVVSHLIQSGPSKLVC